jgi:drug/metabolite transporter (DMT)-like permease
MNQILTGLAIFCGEALVIGVEMWASKFFNPMRPWAVLTPAIAVSIVGVCLLVYGYTFGYQAFKNIWIVTGISIASILVVEPLVAWLLFQEMPTTGAFIALVLGVIGIITSIMVK